MIMARHTVGAARTRLRTARTALVRLDPHLARHTTWKLHGPRVPYTIGTGR